MRHFGKLLVGWDNRSPIRRADFSHVDEEYERLQKEGKRLVLGTLPSRSGTKWLCDIFEAHDNGTGRPEPHYDAAAFYRWVTYNKLPVDTSGVMATFKHGIIEQWKRKGDVALVFSPHFSHGLIELYRELKPEKIIFAINDPKFTVQSMYNFGFFTQSYVHVDPDKALGYQPTLDGAWPHTFGRLVPKGSFYREWEKLTRIGKLAWWGGMVTQDIHRQLAELPPDVTDIFHLKTADQNYAWYQELAKRYAFTPILSESEFLALKNIRYKKSDNVPHVWSPREQAEFDRYTNEWNVLYETLCLKA
jgi:hypothetical protein